MESKTIYLMEVEVDEYYPVFVPLETPRGGHGTWPTYSIPHDLLVRWKAASAEFNAVQALLRDIVDRRK